MTPYKHRILKTSPAPLNATQPVSETVKKPYKPTRSRPISPKMAQQVIPALKHAQPRSQKLRWEYTVAITATLTRGWGLFLLTSMLILNHPWYRESVILTATSTLK